MEIENTNTNTTKTSITRLATAGIEISRKIAELEKELNAIKEAIRDFAEAEAEGDKRVEIPTAQGTVTVSFRPPRYYVKAGDSPKVENLNIPRKAWEAIFVPKISYNLQKDWETAVTALDGPEEGAVRNVISETVYAPSVSFPK